MLGLELDSAGWHIPVFCGIAGVSKVAIEILAGIVVNAASPSVVRRGGTHAAVEKVPRFLRDGWPEVVNRTIPVTATVTILGTLTCMAIKADLETIA